MNETEWLEWIHPEYMLPVLKGNASDRKLRLLAVAACQKISHLWPNNNESLEALLVSERFAEGEASDQERANSELSLQMAVDSAFDRWNADMGHETPPAGITYWAVRAVFSSLNSDAHKGLSDAIVSAGLALEWSQDECLVAGPANWGGFELTGPWPALIREVIGNPFHVVDVDENWNSPDSVELAQTIYNEREFQRMIALGDILDHDDCGNQDILNHCRQPAEHVRGCWVLDLILGNK